MSSPSSTRSFSRSDRLHTAFTAAVALAWICGAAAAQERPPWWDARWPRRTLLRLGEAPGPLVGGYAWLHLPTGLDFGGRDLRVVSPDGRTLPFGILHSDGKGRYLIAFQAPRPHGLYAVYWGNRNAQQAAHQPPRAGLLLETRPLPEDADTTSWSAVQALLRQGGQRYGADVWPRVFDAYNPFGPQRAYVSIYRGYLRCPSDGTYRFATLSDRSSYLLVDGRLVTQWVGPHNIHQGRRGEHSGAVQLTAGVHEFMYVSFALGGPARAAAAWQPPGADRMSIIPPEAFGGLAPAAPVESERLDGPACADFSWRPEAYCEAEASGMILVGFRSLSSATGGLIADYAWDFGDGQTSTERDAQHVFLAPGTYRVTLRVVSTAGHTDVCTKVLSVRPIYSDLDFTRTKMQRFATVVRHYRLEALPSGCLLGAWRLLKALDEKDSAARAAHLLLVRKEGLEPQARYEVAMWLAEYYRTARADPDQAEKYLQTAIEAAAGDKRRLTEARLALAEHYLFARGETGRAREVLSALLEQSQQASADLRRRVLVRMGDSYRYEGKAKEARRYYLEAEAVPVGTDESPRAVLVGSLLQQATAELRSGRPQQALDTLEKLLWQFPTLNLQGEPALLRSQALWQLHRFEEARREAEAFAAFGRDPNWLPALHLEAARACVELGLDREAEAHYRTIIEKFPESPQAEQARQGLKDLGL